MGMVVTNHSIHEDKGVSVYREDGTVQHVSHCESIYITEEDPSVDTESDQCNVDVLFDITKSNSDNGLVSGWANVSVNADGSVPLDWQDDVIRPDVLEKAAIKFMMDYRGSGVMHEGESKGTVVESIVFTKDKQACIGIPEGTVPEGWFITVKVTDTDVFEKVKDGTFKMFSIQGSAKRIKL